MADTPAPGFATLAIHAGAQPDPATGARATPIYQTTSFVFDDVDHAASLFGLQAFGNIYSRITNPTNAVLEERVAALEGGTAALAVASGHAAQVVVLHALMTPGDELIASTKLYGGSINQFNHSFKNFGWNVKWADPDNLSTFEQAVSPKTKAIFIELIANPGGIVTDIEAIAAIAKRARVPLIVDNTLASPYLIRPFEHGADIIVHSATKFLGGHGNSIGGVIVDGGKFDWLADKRYPMISAPRPEYGGMILGETFGNFGFAIACRVLGLRDLGPALSPFNAFLILTGIETLPLAHAAPFRECARRGDAPAGAQKGEMGELSRPRRRPLSQSGEALLPERRRRGVHLRSDRRLRCRRDAGAKFKTVLASRQCRRHALAGYSSRVDHAPPIGRRAEGRRRRRAGCGAAVGRVGGHGGFDRGFGSGARGVVIERHFARRRSALIMPATLSRCTENIQPGTEVKNCVRG